MSDEQVIDPKDVKDPPPSEKPPAPPPVKKPTRPNIELSAVEHNMITKTFGGIQNIKKISRESENTDVNILAQVGMLESSLWNGLVQQFGFDSIEEARSLGYTFNIRNVPILECRKA